jgi:hypothetical protein
VVLSIFFVILLQKSSRKNENISPFLPGRGGLFQFYYFYVQKEYRCLQRQQEEEETNERAVLCARVCVSLSLFFLCVRNMYTKAETQKKMERREKKDQKKRAKTRGEKGK